ncbi:hypothetical protein GFA94_05365 [Escherichia coli]|nr:hypothetical protein [Escherichia coli]EEW1003330.1 hypothetical protein [Escherichia coli]EEY5719063.1 hypothetical protein [Escherichia coli]EFH9088602.1 hypothetical protein [Escherichia coli]MHN56732.1 hypothetical protein [Escherichia coli]
MKKTAPDGAVSGMPAIRETGPGKNLQAITVSTIHCNTLNLYDFVGRIRRSRRIRHKQSALCKSFEAAQLRRLPSGRNFVNLRNA